MSREDWPTVRLRPDVAAKVFETKDSGERSEYDSGMVRDTEKGKPRFSLALPQGVPYEEQFLTRFAALLARGAEKYDARNWEKAEGQEELERYHSSAFRHLIQWITGETDEDHAAAVAFNLMAAETVKYKMRNFIEEFNEEAKKPHVKLPLDCQSCFRLRKASPGRACSTPAAHSAD